MNAKERQVVLKKIEHVADIVFRMVKATKNEKSSDVALAALSVMTFVLSEMDPEERHLRYGMIRKMLDDFYNGLDDPLAERYH